MKTTILLALIVIYVICVTVEIIVEIVQNRRANKKQISYIYDILRIEKETRNIINSLHERICMIENKMIDYKVIDYNSFRNKVLDDKKLLTMKEYTNLADKISEVDDFKKKIETMKELNNCGIICDIEYKETEKND